MIYDVIGDFHRSTCLRWVDGDKVPYNATEHVVFQWVEQNYTCRTHQKLRGGKVVVELADSCFMKRVLTHLMMHVLGFAHEHQRADRNCYVFVDYRELRRGKQACSLYIFQIMRPSRGEGGNTRYLRFEGFQTPQFLTKISKNKHYLSVNVTNGTKIILMVFTIISRYFL